MDPIQSKYWNDQIKSLVGPCMVTFAIPLTIPGLTITLVAFSDEKSFPVYGTLHITGLIILIISVLLIISGCILKFIWKPIILPDIERQLSPRESFRSERGDSFYRREIERIQRENLRRSDPATERQRKNSPTKTEETVLDSQKGTETIKSIDVAQPGKAGKQSGNRSTEQDDAQPSTVGKSLSALPTNDLYFQSPRGGRLPPIETTDKGPVPRNRVPSSDHDVPDVHVSRGIRLSDPGETESASRKKKKKRKRHRRSEEGGKTKGKEDEGEEEEEETIQRRDEVKDNVPYAQSQLQLPKLQKAREHLLDENNSGESAISSNRSLLDEEKSDTGKKRKRRRKKKALSSLRQESKEQTNSVQSVYRSSSHGSCNDDDVTTRNLSDSDSPHPIDSN